MSASADELFGSSVLNPTNGSINKESFVAELVPKIQAILDKEFPNNPQKRKIKIYRDRISFAAPCCGDSAHDNHKKRGNIILEGKFKNMYKCHNCGACMSIYNFFKTFGQSLSLESITYISEHKSALSSPTQFGDSSINYIYDANKIDAVAIDRETFKAYLGLEECDVPNEGHFYLVNRRQFDFSRFLYSSKFKKLFVLNLTKSGKIFGLQVRSIDKAYTGPKYKTYNLSKIYEMIFKQNVEIPDDINTLSMIFNILLVDYASPVTVFEGPMDSFVVKNSIALLGAGKHITFPFYHRYMFDDDDAGRKHAIEHLNDGYDVFMWDKFKKDIGLPYKKKWDMNDVVIWANKNNVKLPWLDGYFTHDVLDMISI